jgi:hypothetical protein
MHRVQQTFLDEINAHSQPRINIKSLCKSGFTTL